MSSHPAVFFSHNKPVNSAFSTINQRNEQAVSMGVIFIDIISSILLSVAGLLWKYTAHYS
jgi:hypothetical protein